MSEVLRRLSRVFFDLRLIVVLIGIALSVVMHELFHVIVHWGDITSVNILPDGQAIAEVVFTPSGDYDLAFEEMLAYGITMVTLVLTAMLVCDIYDAKDQRTAKQTILSNRADKLADDYLSTEQLAELLGLRMVTDEREN